MIQKEFTNHSIIQVDHFKKFFLKLHDHILKPNHYIASYEIVPPHKGCSHMHAWPLCWNFGQISLVNSQENFCGIFLGNSLNQTIVHVLKTMPIAHKGRSWPQSVGLFLAYCSPSWPTDHSLYHLELGSRVSHGRRVYFDIIFILLCQPLAWRVTSSLFVSLLSLSLYTG